MLFSGLDLALSDRISMATGTNVVTQKFDA